MSTMIDKEKIIDKIRKLQIQSDSAKSIGNEQEALAFAEKSQLLMMQYQIEVSSLEIPDDPINTEYINWTNFGFKTVKKRQGWVETLTSLIASKNCCKIAVYPKTNIIQVYGTEINRKIAIHIIGTLIPFVNKKAEEEYRKFYYQCKKNHTLYLTEGFKKSFLFGFIVKLSDRYKEIQDNSDERALVLIDKELKRVQDEMDHLSKAKKLNTECYNRNGFEAGQELGDSVDIQRKDNRLESRL